MLTLSNLPRCKNRKKATRVGRGPGSGRGKTCCRGQKGAGSRSGYKRRYGQCGGGVPLHMKVPARGFGRGRFKDEWVVVNLEVIDEIFNDGDVVSVEALKSKGFKFGKSKLIKLLGDGEVSKKLKIELDGISQKARDKIESKGGEFVKLVRNEYFSL